MQKKKREISMDDKAQITHLSQYPSRCEFLSKLSRKDREAILDSSVRSTLRYAPSQKALALLNRESTDIDDAEAFIASTKGRSTELLSRELYAVAKVTLDTMQLRTVDDYFLYFTCAAYLNHHVKEYHTGYGFKTKLIYGLRAISADHRANVNADVVARTSFCRSFQGKSPTLAVTVADVDFGFHYPTAQILFSSTTPGVKNKPYKDRELRKITPDLLKYALNLKNLTKESWIRDYTGCPIPMRYLQALAYDNASNKNSVYYEPNFDNIVPRLTKREFTKPETPKNPISEIELHKDQNKSDKLDKAYYDRDNMSALDSTLDEALSARNTPSWYEARTTAERVRQYRETVDKYDTRQVKKFKQAKKYKNIEDSAKRIIHEYTM